MEIIHFISKLQAFLRLTLFRLAYHSRLSDKLLLILCHHLSYQGLCCLVLLILLRLLVYRGLIEWCIIRLNRHLPILG